MKKKIAVVMLALAVFVSGVSINTKAESLKLSESNIEFYPSQTGRVVISSQSNIDGNKLQIKSKNINVKKEICLRVDTESECVLAFNGFQEANEKIEIKYENQSYYVNVNIKSFGDHKESMSLQEQYELELAKILTKYHVLSTDDIKDEKVRLDVEEQLEKLKDKYSEPEDKDKTNNIDDYAVSTAVGDVLLTADANTSGVVYGHAGIHSTENHTTVETRGFFTGGVKVYKNSITNTWHKYKKKTGLWTVNGATQAKKKNAVAWAKKQKGKEYGFIEAGDTFFFCTKLVWRSWESQKVKLGHYWFATDMMKHSTPLKLRNLYHK